MTQSDIAVRALDQTRHIANGEPMPVWKFHNANLGMKRGERIRGDLRARLGDRFEKSRFAGVGIADQSNVGDDAQLDQELPLFARLSRLREARSLPRGRDEVAVAQAAASAFAEHELLPVLGEVGDEFALFV